MESLEAKSPMLET